MVVSDIVITKSLSVRQYFDNLSDELLVRESHCGTTSDYFVYSVYQH